MGQYFLSFIVEVSVSSGVENSCNMIFGTLVSVLYSIDVLC